MNCDLFPVYFFAKIFVQSPDLTRSSYVSVAWKSFSKIVIKIYIIMGLLF